MRMIYNLYTMYVWCCITSIVSKPTQGLHIFKITRLYLVIDMHIRYISIDQHHSRESGVFRTHRRAYVKLLYDYIRIDDITIQGCYVHCVETISRLLFAISRRMSSIITSCGHTHTCIHMIYITYIFILCCNICKLYGQFFLCSFQQGAHPNYAM